MIVKKTIRQQVYEIVKGRILSGEYSFSANISIAALSEELMVSNTPIREALSLLESEGLIQSFPGAKYCVVPFSRESRQELRQTVLALLLGAYEIILSAGNEKKLLKMMDRALIAQRRAVNDADNCVYATASLDFDECIVASTGNKKMISLFKGLRAQLMMFMFYEGNMDENARLKDYNDHMEMFRAIWEGRTEDLHTILRRRYSTN